MNIKISTVATNVFGKSGMAMLNAIAQGETDASHLAELAVGLLRKKVLELQQALAGYIGNHHRFLLRLQLDRLRRVEEDLRLIDEQVISRMEPYKQQLQLLQDIPGIGQYTARTILSELGPDISAFANEHRLAASVGVAPGSR